MDSALRTARNRRAPSRGVTLLELLIVMTIMVMVTAAAIPVMLPAMQNRRMRESSRLVSAFVSGARSKAIANGRPVGVMLERFNGQPYAMSLSYVEVPLPYAGDTTSSRITVTSGGQITNFVNGDTLWQNQIRVGDLVRLDYKGPLFALSVTPPLPPTALPPGQVLTSSNAPNAPTNNIWQLVRTDNSGAPIRLPPAYSSPPGVPFQIYRQPVRSSAAPLQLPEGVVIDLISSGIGTSGAFPTGPLAPATWNTNPPVPFNPVFTFTPNGAVDCVWTPTAQRPQGTIYLLVGQRDLMSDVSKNVGNDENVWDFDNLAATGALIQNRYLQNFWVSIGSQTGLVAVNENAAGNNGQVDLARGGASQSFTQPTGGQ